jgi:ketosteroid isomerase-like protein
MSQENLEAAKAQYRRWNASEIAEWIAGFDPEAIFISSVTAGLDGHGEFHGHEGIRRFVAQYFEAWEYFRLEPREYIPVDDRVVVVMHAVGRGRESGVTTHHDLAHVWTFRGGLATGHASFQTRAEALQAAGMSE